MSPRSRIRARHWVSADHGNATVEFALVAPLLMLVGLAVLQLILALHVRTVMTSAALEGARVGALVGTDLDQATARTDSILRSTIAGTAVTDIRAHRTVIGSVPMIAVEVDADLPLLGLYGPTSMTVSGHAFAE